MIKEKIFEIYNEKVVLIPLIGNEQYFISKSGNVYSSNYRKKGNIEQLKSNIDTRGYYQVNMNIFGKHKPYLLHRIISLTFIPNPKNKPCVNHKNGKKLNNELQNLEWVTHSENSTHAFKNKLKLPTVLRKGGDSPYAIKVQQFNKEGELIKTWGSMTDAGNAGFRKDCISQCVLGNHKTHKGFIWKKLK